MRIEFYFNFFFSGDYEILEIWIFRNSC